MRLLRGAETNIMDYDGSVDLDQETLQSLDIAIASLHPPCIDFADSKTVTRGVEKVMENPYITVIGHPGDNRYPMDYERIVRKAKETGTLLEVNNSSLKPTSFRPGGRENLMEMLTYCKQYETPVVLGSDAHFCADIGDFEAALCLLEEVDFPMELVMNGDPERLLRFISQKRLK